MECYRLNSDNTYLFRFGVEFKSCAKFITHTLSQQQYVEIASSKLPHPESDKVELFVKFGPDIPSPILSLIRDAIRTSLKNVEDLRSLTWSADSDRFGRVGGGYLSGIGPDQISALRETALNDVECVCMSRIEIVENTSSVPNRFIESQLRGLTVTNKGPFRRDVPAFTLDTKDVDGRIVRASHIVRTQECGICNGANTRLFAIPPSCRVVAKMFVHAKSGDAACVFGTVDMVRSHINEEYMLSNIERDERLSLWNKIQSYVEGGDKKPWGFSPLTLSWCEQKHTIVESDFPTPSVPGFDLARINSIQQDYKRRSTDANYITSTNSGDVFFWIETNGGLDPQHVFLSSIDIITRSLIKFDTCVMQTCVSNKPFERNNIVHTLDVP